MLEIHPLALIFPLMSGDEYERLKADIKRNGLRLPITLHEGKILDGRNRYNACRDLGIEPTTTEFIGPGEPVEFVASVNLHRRHLNDSQRAMIAAKLANLGTGQRLDLAKKKEGLQICRPSFSQASAAKLLNVSTGTVSAAVRIIEGGTPEEVAAVEAGQMAVSGLAQEIKNGVPPERRTKMKKPKPERGMSRMGRTVMQMIAEDQKKKDEKAARRKLRLATVHGERVHQPIMPAPSFAECIAALIRMELSHDTAAEELRARRIKPADLESLVLWLVDVEAKLREEVKA